MSRIETIERRRTQRFHLTLPIHVVRLAQKRVDLSGKTRDLSASGAYFVVDRNVATGTPIEFFVTLQEPSRPAREVKLRCRGHVTRLDKLGASERWGVAATIDRYQFVRDSPN